MCNDRSNERICFDALDIVDSNHLVAGTRHHLRLLGEGDEMSSQSEYMREYRKTETGIHGVERQKRRDRARQKALRRLASIHEREFLDILNEELRVEGL